MLLSPAGLGASPTASTSHTHTLSGLDRRMLNVATRPGIKRTASTSSVNEMGELNLPPSMQGKAAGRRRPGKEGYRSDSYSSDMEHDDEDEDGMGTLEDWIPEKGEDAVEDDEDPFSATTSKGGRSRRTSSSMLMASPGSSPTPALSHTHSKMLTGSGSSGRMALDSDDEDIVERDDVDNNPFLANNNNGPPRAPRKRAADSRPKVSYVFRGKRITYDAPLESIFPAEDSDEEALPGMLSGPRVLFPPPATPSSTAPSLKLSNVSPPANTSSASVRNIELMQTPRRQTASSSSSVAASSKAGSKGGEVLGKRQRDEPELQPRVIPPTPASLPQKSREQVQMERERFQSAMRGLQHGTAASSRHARRAAPYPPR